MRAAAQISRRELFSRLFRVGRTEPEPRVDATKVAVIQGRFCLAYRNSFCSACYERCPVPGAIVTERGIPRVVSSACTGCGVCYEVCPAPRKAVLMLAKPAERGGDGASPSD